MSGPWDKYASADGPWSKYGATQPEKAPDPLEGMSTTEKVLAGAGKFVSDTGTGAKGFLDDLAAGLEASMPESVQRGASWINEKLGMKTAKDIQQQGRANIAETRKRDAPLMDTGAGMAGYFLGGAATAPLLPAANTVKGVAALGGLIGATQPAVNWQERGINTAVGAGAGALGQKAVNALSRIVQPNTSAQVKSLMAEGITPTPGQILGGGFKRAEEGLSSLPIVGDSIKAGQRRAVEEMNRAAYSRALEPIGAKLPKGVIGREAVEYTKTKLGDAYGALLPKMTAQVDDQFTSGIDSLRAMVANGAIDPKAASAFERIVENDVVRKFQGQGAITGQTLKMVESDLTNQIKRFGLSQDADQRLVGDALKEVQATLRDLVQRTNPKYAKELQAINAGYANFKKVQRAAASLGAEDGVFSPAQLQSAVKAADRSKDKARFAEGNALMQDLSEASKTVLGNNVPDSGTPFRALTTLMATGGAGATLGPGAGAAMLTAPVMYSRVGQNALAALLAKRPDQAKEIASLIRLAGPEAASGLAAISAQK